MNCGSFLKRSTRAWKTFTWNSRRKTMQKKSNLLRLFLFHPEIFIAIIFSAILYLLTRIDYSLTSLNYSFCIASLWYFIFPKYLKNSTKTDLVIKGILILFLSGTFIFSEIVPIILSYILNKISKYLTGFIFKSSIIPELFPMLDKICVEKDFEWVKKDLATKLIGRKSDPYKLFDKKTPDELTNLSDITGF